mgnify:CR=1 FL=1
MNLENFMNTDFFRENIDKNCAISHRVEEREYWERFRGVFLDFLKKRTETSEEAFKILPLSKSMLFKKAGDRITFETLYFKRRHYLVSFAYLEAIENKGEYFNQMLDLLWAVLEETVWAVPAHQKYGADDCVPHENETGLALFVGETAALVSSIYYIFKNQFDAISPEIGNRIRRRIKKEIYENFLNNDYYWMGFGRIPNNWNPWIVSNVVKTIINLEEYGDIEYKVLARSVYIINKYYSHYPLDGGCDEGVTYWGVAGGNLIAYADCIKRLTGGKLELTTDQKVKNTARFTVNMYNAPKFCVSFSDSPAKTKGDWAYMYYVGKVMNDKTIIAYAKESFENAGTEKTPEPSRSDFGRLIYRAEALAELPSVTEKFELPLGQHYDSIKVMIEREKSVAPYGLVLAAKANHNKESHNHLDTGSISIFKNCEPFILDPGNKTYTAQTFSNRRYELWNTQSQFHCLPIIGGCGQKVGREFKGENVVFENSSMTADIEKAYGEDFITKFTRKVGLDRENSRVVLKDYISLTEEKEVEFVFMTNAEVEISDKITLKQNGETMEITVNAPFTPIVENVEDDDPTVINNWGETLKRIRLKTKFKEQETEFIFR